MTKEGSIFAALRSAPGAAAAGGSGTWVWPILKGQALGERGAERELVGHADIHAGIETRAALAAAVIACRSAVARSVASISGVFTRS